MKKHIFLLLFIGYLLPMSGQNTTIQITGKLVDDKTNEGIEFGTVRVLNAKDSTYVTGMTAKETGDFRIMVAPKKYILEMSQMGYTKKYMNIDISKNTALGEISLHENTILLKEAMVEAKAIEIQVRGDTIEYNADSYKVQESAVVEDLLKKMPGVEIDEDGKITVNGKEVKKFLVDGKEFFSDDPKVASKNLPAQMVDKLQVVDRKSDMAQMTGFDDGEEETVINLTVKKGMKESVFGNAFAGYGNKGRYEANGMVNYMRNNTQMSALGGINNTNNAGFSDFASSMSGGRGGMRFGGRNGISKSINGGFNFATEHSDKLKWGGDMRYGNVDNEVKSTKNTIYTEGGNVANGGDVVTEESYGRNKSDNFGVNLRFEWAPDSVTKIIFSPNMQYNKNNNEQYSTAETVSLDATKNYNSTSEYLTDGKSISLNGRLDISRKLNNKGRVISLGLSGGLKDGDSDGLDYTKIEYVARPDSIIDLKYNQDDKSHNWRAFLSYIEPLGRNNFLELSYSIRNNNSETDKKSYNSIDGTANDKNTRYIQNDFINQNVSLKFRSSREKFNYMLGIGLEPSSSKTTLYQPNEADVSAPRKNYLSFAPSGQFNYLWSKTSNLRIDYSGTTNQPTTLQLFKGVYSYQGLNTTSGNPDLRPSFRNTLSFRFRNSNPQKGSFIGLFGRLNHTTNDIVTTSVRNDNGGRDMTYANVSGNMGGNARFVFNMPLRNKKFSVSSMSFGGYDISNTLISGEKNKAKILNLHENIGMQFRSDQLDFGVRGNVQFRDMKNSISNTSNSHTFNYGGTGNFTWYVPLKTGIQFDGWHMPIDFVLESDMTYSTNSGYSMGFKQEEWLWNAAFSINTLKKKTGTIRFKIYDILKERSNITRNNSADKIEDITTNTISSYFMVTFVYKFQIFKGGATAPSADSGRGGRGGHGGHPGRF